MGSRRPAVPLPFARPLACPTSAGSHASCVTNRMESSARVCTGWKGGNWQPSTRRHTRAAQRNPLLDHPPLAPSVTPLIMSTTGAALPLGMAASRLRARSAQPATRPGRLPLRVSAVAAVPSVPGWGDAAQQRRPPPPLARGQAGGASPAPQPAAQPAEAGPLEAPRDEAAAAASSAAPGFAAKPHLPSSMYQALPQPPARRPHAHGTGGCSGRRRREALRGRRPTGLPATHQRGGAPTHPAAPTPPHSSPPHRRRSGATQRRSAAARPSTCGSRAAPPAAAPARSAATRRGSGAARWPSACR